MKKIGFVCVLALLTPCLHAQQRQQQLEVNNYFAYRSFDKIRKFQGSATLKLPDYLPTEPQGGDLDSARRSAYSPTGLNRLKFLHANPGITTAALSCADQRQTGTLTGHPVRAGHDLDRMSYHPFSWNRYVSATRLVSFQSRRA